MTVYTFHVLLINELTRTLEIDNRKKDILVIYRDRYDRDRGDWMEGKYRYENLIKMLE